MGVFKKQGVWWVDFYALGRRKRERIGPDRKFAERVLAKRRVEILEGRFFDKKKECRMILRQLAEKYQEYSKVNKRSWKRDVTSCKHLVAHFGDKPLRAITPESVERYKTKRLQEKPLRGTAPRMAPASINREVDCLRAMFTWAENNGWIEGHPVRKVKKLREANERDRVLTEQEFGALVEAAAPHLKPILLVAYHTGMREGEILKLTWDRIDLRRGLIRLKGGATKTDEARLIPLLPDVIESLRSQARRVGSPWVFGYRDKRPLKGVRTAFETARRIAGIEDFHFQDLRHCFVTNARRARIDQITIMSITGHKTTAVFRRYNTIEEADVLEAGRRIQEFRTRGREVGRKETMA